MADTPPLHVSLIQISSFFRASFLVLALPLSAATSTYTRVELPPEQNAFRLLIQAAEGPMVWYLVGLAVEGLDAMVESNDWGTVFGSELTGGAQGRACPTNLLGRSTVLAGIAAHDKLPARSVANRTRLSLTRAVLALEIDK